jgi:hypothetical protein
MRERYKKPPGSLTSRGGFEVQFKNDRDPLGPMRFQASVEASVAPPK